MNRFFIYITVSMIFLFSCDREKTVPRYMIARSTSWQTVNISNSETKILGFSDDIVLEIAKTEEFRVQLVGYDGNFILQALNLNGVSAVLSNIQPSQDLLQEYTFSDPYFITGPVLLIRKNDNFQTLHDLHDRVVGYERYYHFPLEFPAAAECILRPYDDQGSAVEALLNSSVDAIIIEANAAHQFASGLYANNVKIAGPPLQVSGLYLITKKGKEDKLIRKFNKGLNTLQQGDLYQKMLLYWGLFDAMHPEE